MVVNATPLAGEEGPVALATIARAALILDLAYGAELTPWVSAARAAGASRRATAWGCWCPPGAALARAVVRRRGAARRRSRAPSGGRDEARPRARRGGRSAALGDLVAFALPQRCPGCGGAAEPERLLCERLPERIPRSRSRCARAAWRGARAGRLPARTPGIARVAAPGSTTSAPRCVVHALKYGGRPRLAGALGRAAARAACPPGSGPDLVIEVPLHPARRRERGYNQAGRAGRRARRARLGVPRLDGRARARAPDAGAGAARARRERRGNVAGAFRVRRPRGARRDGRCWSWTT